MVKDIYTSYFHIIKVSINILFFFHQTSSQGNLAQHKRALHEGVKYPCSRCGNQFTSKVNLTQHIRTVHEVVKYPCGQCFLQNLVLLGTKGQYMKESKKLLINLKYANHFVNIFTPNKLMLKFYSKWKGGTPTGLSPWTHKPYIFKF